MDCINNITVEQIKLMQHAIGFDKNIIKGIKHRVMYAYRNHFCDYKDNIAWNELVGLGLARKNITEDKNGVAYYHLTLEGFKLLATLCGFEKIIEIN